MSLTGLEASHIRLREAGLSSESPAVERSSDFWIFQHSIRKEGSQRESDCEKIGVEKHGIKTVAVQVGAPRLAVGQRAEAPGATWRPLVAPECPW